MFILRSSWKLTPLIISFLVWGCKKEAPLLPTTASVFVTNQNGESISVIDANTNTLKTAISVSVSMNEMMMPHNVQVAPDGKSIWATVNAMDFTVPDQVIVIDPILNMITQKINIGKAVHVAHVVLDDENNFAYATATDSNMIVQINARTYLVERRIYIGAGHKPHGIRYRNHHLYVANMMSGTATIIDLSNYQVTDIPIGGMAMQTAVTKDGKFAYFSLNDMKSIAVCNLLTNQVEQIDLPASAKGPVQICLTPDEKLLFVCDQGLAGSNASDQVFVLDTYLKKIKATINSGKGAHGITIDPAGRFAYVTNCVANTVSVIDIKNLRLMCNVATETFPTGVTYWYAFSGRI